MSSIQRIGGGGGVSSPALGVLERMRALDEQAVALLARIEAKTGVSGSGVANVPGIGDGLMD